MSLENKESEETYGHEELPAEVTVSWGGLMLLKGEDFEKVERRKVMLVNEGGITVYPPIRGGCVPSPYANAENP